MSIHSVTSSSNSEPFMQQDSSYKIIKGEDFFSRFTEKKSWHIATDEMGHSSDKSKSITSVAIGDCITVFAIKQQATQDQVIMGWHISRDKSLESIKDDFSVYASHEGDYFLYIVGGNTSTTEGKDCLWSRIDQAIDDCFNDNVTINDDFLNFNTKTKSKFTYISANLQMNGKLYLCQHD